jgi:serine/threonine protein kinase
VLIGQGHTEAGKPRIEPGFTAPEVIKGGQPDSQSDVYEGARTLLFGLHGQTLNPTVEHDEFMNTLEAVPPPELSGDFPSRVPNGIRFVIQDALDPTPANRPAMGELVQTVADSLPLEAAA